jgi:hypothetical protein
MWIVVERSVPDVKMDTLARRMVTVTVMYAKTEHVLVSIMDQCWPTIEVEITLCSSR